MLYNNASKKKVLLPPLFPSATSFVCSELLEIATGFSTIFDISSGFPITGGAVIMTEERPLCGCGAGFCRLDAVAVGGPNFGRKFYVCPIKKGQGACSFFSWQDADLNVPSPVSTLTDSISISSSDSGFIGESQHDDLGKGNASYSGVAASSLRSGEQVLLSPASSKNVVNIGLDGSDDVRESQPNNSRQGNTVQSQGSNSSLLKSALLKRNNLRLGELRECEDEFDVPLTKKSKQLREGDFESDGSLPGSSSMLQRIVPLEISKNRLSSGSSELEMDSHHEETTSLTVYDSLLSSCQCSSSLLIDFEIFQHSCWMSAARGETLRNQIPGWWGRLAFPPSKCLTERVQKPYICCVFPSFDPIFVPPNVYRAAAPHAGGDATELVSSQGNILMKKLVSKALVKAAVQLQADLLDILRPLDMKDHETMTREANTTFDALDRLGIDHRKFREQVKEFIQRASLLSKIDQSISSNHSCEKLNDSLNRKKLKLTEIKDAQARISDALSVSTQSAALLTEKISHLKDKLRGAEAELACCSSESASFKVQLSQISKDRVKSEHSLKITRDRLKDAWRLRKVMEAEKEAAKAAFDKARALL